MILVVNEENGKKLTRMFKSEDDQLITLGIIKPLEIIKGKLVGKNFKASNGYTCKLFEAVDGRKFEVFNADWSVREIK